MDVFVSRHYSSLVFLCLVVIRVISVILRFYGYDTNNGKTSKDKRRIMTRITNRHECVTMTDNECRVVMVNILDVRALPSF